MDGQFDKIAAAYQNQLGPYDYYSVMHYDSTAFSRNGQHTIRTVVPGFTDIIGTAKTLSQVDLIKVATVFYCYLAIGGGVLAEWIVLEGLELSWTSLI